MTSGCVDAYYWFYFFNQTGSLAMFFDKTMDLHGKHFYVIIDGHAGCGTAPVKRTLNEAGVDMSMVDMQSATPVIDLEGVLVYKVETR